MTKLSPEEKLKKIIQAQVDGGCDKYDVFPRGFEFMFDEYRNCTFHHNSPEDENTYDWCPPYSLLEILLDTKGCKAAYGDSKYIGEIRSIENDSEGRPAMSPSWKEVSFVILNVWHSGEGNNWEEAINTAFELLPK